MKQTICVVIACLVLTGCGSKDATVIDANGSNVSVTQEGAKTEVLSADGTKLSSDGKTMTATDGKGNTYSAGLTVSESDLGLPFYPGSVEKPEVSLSTTEGDKRVVMSGRTTKDEPAKVAAFYKAKIENPSESSVGSTVNISGKLKGGDITVIASKNKASETEILVTVTRIK